MSSELKPGLLLRGKWRLEKFLGRGGMSAVWSATHRNGMRGAIKILHRELNDNAVVKGRFLREGYVANKVEHPGAVKVLDDDITEDGLVFLVMELLEGETLKQRWIANDRRMDVSNTLEIVDHVLDVLESAHARGIVHRDLKPDNIFLLENGTTKVLDFGIARVLEAAMPNAADATSSAAMMGTPAFMPPEQALAHWKKVDGRADIFAIAATAFTVLTGRLVHSGSTIPELLVAAATKPANPIRTVMPELDEAIAAAIDRGLRFEIAERWPDARGMRLALLQARTKASANRTVKLLISDYSLSGPEHVSEIKLPVAPQVGSPEAKPGGTAAIAPESSAQEEPTILRPPPSLATDTVVGPRTEPMDESTREDSASKRQPEAPKTHFMVEPTTGGASAVSDVRVPLGPQRRTPKTLATINDAVVVPQTAPPAALELTPVRLQGRMKVEHVVGLSAATGKSSVGQSKRSSTLLWWIFGAAASVGVAVIVLLVNRTGGTGARSNTSVSARSPEVSALPPSTSPPVASPPAATPTGPPPQLTNPPADSAPVPSAPVPRDSAAPSASASAAPVKSTQVPNPGLRPPVTAPAPPPRVCLKPNEFDARQCDVWSR